MNIRIERVDEASEAHLDGDGLHTKGIRDGLGELHVVAIGIGTVDVLYGDGVVGRLSGLPVVGSLLSRIPTPMESLPS